MTGLSVDPRNRLRGLRSILGFTSTGLPRRAVSVEGAWTLAGDRELRYTVRDAKEQAARRQLSLRGSIVDAKAHALIFAVRQVDETALPVTQDLALSGRWQANADNRLTFLVERAQGAEDRLTLEGGWELGERHELRYRVRRNGRPQRTVTFAGAWDVTAADRLVYRLSGSDRSAFEFRAALQSPSLVAKAGRLVYQVGIGLSGGRTQRRRVALIGTWKLNRDLSVAFEVPYADGRIQAIRFEGAVALTARNRVAISLQSRRREPLGVTVTFTRDLTPDTRLFLRLRKNAEERAVLGGVEVRF